jgi:hypothetical protein
MRLARSFALAALALAVGAGSCLADCADDLRGLKARVVREKDPVKSAAAKKQVMLADQNVRGSESECRNAVTRGYRILNQPANEQTAHAGNRKPPTAPEPGKPWNSIR